MFGDDQSDSRLTVQTRLCSWLFRSVFGIPNVAELDRIGAAIGNDQIIELGRLHKSAHCANRQFAGPFVNSAARHFHILGAHRIGDFGNSDIESSQLVRIYPNLYLPRSAPNDLYLADAVDRFNLLLNLFVGYVGASRNERGADTAILTTGAASVSNF